MPLKVKTVLRATTNSADTRDRSVMMSSVSPSAKYSWSGSPLMLTKGNTAIAGGRSRAGGGTGMRAGAASIRCGSLPAGRGCPGLALGARANSVSASR
jgi:hypothetical protein